MEVGTTCVHEFKCERERRGNCMISSRGVVNVSFYKHYAHAILSFVYPDAGVVSDI